MGNLWLRLRDVAMVCEAASLRVLAVSLVLTCTLVGSVRGAIGAVPVGSERIVTFRAANLPQPTESDVAAEAERAVLRSFLDAHRGIVIERFAMPQVEGAGLDAGPLMAISAGVPPHAIYVNFRQSSTYINHGFLEPLEVLLARVHSENAAVREVDAEGEWLEDPAESEVRRALTDIRARVPEPAWPVMYRTPWNRQVGDEPHVWALPTSVLVRALVYRRDLFHEAGLDPERPPRTWSELEEYADKLTVPERGQMGLMVVGGPNISWGVYNLLVSNGVRVMVRDGGRWSAAFATPEAVEAVRFVDRLAAMGVLRAETGGPTYNLLWDQGRVGMRFDYLDAELLAQVNPQLVGIAPSPAPPSGSRAGELNCRMMGVFAGSTPQQKLAVMRYLWFITGEEAERIRTRVYVDHGYGRFVNPVLLEKFGYERLLRQVPVGWREAFERALEEGVPEPYGKNTQLIYQHLSVPINRALSADLSSLSDDEAQRLIHGWLAEAAERVDSQVLGRISEEEMARRRTVGGAVLAGLVVLFAGALVWVWRGFSRAAADAERKPWRRYVWGYALLAPAMALLVLWSYLPLAGGAVLALLEYELVIDSAFVGVDQFANALFDERFWASLWRTFYFVALTIALGFWPPILLAILLDEVPTEVLKYSFRTVFYLPQVVSGVIMIFLWRQLYDASAAGFLNQLLLMFNHLGPIAATVVKLVGVALWLSLLVSLLSIPVKLAELSVPLRLTIGGAGVVMAVLTFGPLIHDPAVLERLVGRFELSPLGWVEDPAMAMVCVVIPMVWATAGPGCIIYLAALKTVPSDMYEAAAIDGAGAFQRIFYITLPRLKFLIVIQFIAAVIAAFKGGTDFILALTGGGPNGATRTLSLDVFERTFLELRFGLGAAMAWLLGGLLILFAAWQLRMMSRAEFRASGSRGGA